MLHGVVRGGLEGRILPINGSCARTVPPSASSETPARFAENQRVCPPDELARPYPSCHADKLHCTVPDAHLQPVSVGLGGMPRRIGCFGPSGSKMDSHCAYPEAAAARTQWAVTTSATP